MTAGPVDNLSEPQRRWLTPVMHKVAVGLLVVVGAQCWLLLGRSDYGRWSQRLLLIAALVVALVPPVSRRFLKILDLIRYPSRRARIVAAVCIAVFSSCYLVFTAWLQGRNFQPKWQDEMSYVIQFRMLAEGRLWMPRHELADFFDSFQLIVDPVYASMYFPGAALLYTPAVWTRAPFWVMSALAAGVSVALFYLIVTDLIDGAAGALAVPMFLGLSMFRKLSLMLGGHPPMLMIGLAMVYCYLRWREHQLARWALALGIFAGWGALTRPLDAVVFALPIGFAMFVDLIKQPPRRWITAAACLFAGAPPFLILQIVFNLGVTGKWNETPFELYANRDYPGTTLGFHDFDPALRPVSSLPQKHKYYDEWTIPAIKKHRPETMVRNWLGESPEQPGYLARTLSDGMPHRLMFVLLPACVLGLSDRRRLALWLALPGFVILFSFYTYFLPHYMIIVAPAILFSVLLGARVIETAWPRAQAAVATFLTLAIVILSLTEMAEFNRLAADEPFDPAGLRAVADRLAQLERKPAVVLFRFRPDNTPHEEPVYNTKTAWPDESIVIRAHDLGDRNVEIFRYYAARQPKRAFYLYDRGDASITYLGTARELAGRPATRPAER